MSELKLENLPSVRFGGHGIESFRSAVKISSKLDNEITMDIRDGHMHMSVMDTSHTALIRYGIWSAYNVSIQGTGTCRVNTEQLLQVLNAMNRHELIMSVRDGKLYLEESSQVSAYKAKINMDEVANYDEKNIHVEYQLSKNLDKKDMTRISKVCSEGHFVELDLREQDILDSMRSCDAERVGLKSERIHYRTDNLKVVFSTFKDLPNVKIHVPKEKAPIRISQERGNMIMSYYQAPVY